MKKVVFAAFFCVLGFVSPSDAQHLEFGLMAGISGYDGELAPDAFGDRFSIIHPSVGVFGRYNFNDFFAARLGLQYGTISGDDGLSDNSRNLDFRSSILEVGLIGEWNILGYQPYNLYRVFSPYLFAGVAFSSFNPVTEYNGEDVELQPLGTEGQGLDGRPGLYNLTTLAIPVGIGAKVALNDLWNIGVEAGLRLTRTDYLDDVSTTYVGYDELLNARGELSAILANRSEMARIAGDPRGNPDNNDVYYFVGVFLSYNFMDTGLAGARGRTKRGRGCY
mgnify:CR=1 FL=1|jgi:hypothetical protein